MMTKIDRTSILQALREQCYTVLAADSFQDAMAAFDVHVDNIQLLVADISLPDGNGCALAVMMQKRQPDLRVLFVSGHVGAEICRYYGVDVNDLHFLRKPFGRDELVSRVEAVLLSEDPFPPLYFPVAVGTAIADRPPHRSVRAELPHTAPA